ncbi:hypothetical protein, partial [Enterococcus faecium]|uniref:hypothetical protein n=1 Tax=Enterococcus faecium TaxID=1352 RepID=UPI003F41E354
VPEIIIGSGAPLLAEAAPAARLDPRGHAEPLALVRLTQAAPEPTAAPKPLYLRAPDAKTLAERGVAR